jgi:hypothetical protein
MDHSAARGTRDLSDDMTAEEYQAYQEAQDAKATALFNSMTPEEKALSELLGTTFDKIINAKYNA